MKKVWPVLLAVVLVFGLVAIGCGSSGGGGGDEGDLVEKTVFVLSTDEGIQALDVGALSFAGDENPIKPLVRAGGDTNISIEAIKTPGDTIGLKFKTLAEWGAGIDLPFKEFGFREGDVVTVTGKLVAGTKTQLNFKEGSEATHEETTTTEVGDFDYSVVLSATDVLNIKGGKSTQVIRIEGRPTNVEVEVYEITIKGKRPSKLTKLEAPVITASATGISWTEIENASGFKVLIAKDGEEYDEEEAESLPATATGYNMSALDDGTYKVNVTALGLKDATTDSDPVEVKVSRTTPAGIEEKDANLSGATAVGTGSVTKTTSSFTLTYPATGTDVGYGNGYAYFQYDFGAGKSINDVKEIKFTFKGEAGDVGWKDVFLFATKTTPVALEGSGSNLAKVNFAAANTTAANGTFDLSSADVSALTDQQLYIAIVLWANNASSGTATSYTISDVKFVFGKPTVYAIVE